MSHENQTQMASPEAPRRSSISPRLKGALLATVLGLALTSCRATNIMSPVSSGPQTSPLHGTQLPFPSVGSGSGALRIERGAERLRYVGPGAERLRAAERAAEKLRAAERGAERLRVAERGFER